MPRRRRPRIGRILIALPLVLLLIAGVTAWWFDSKPTRVDALSVHAVGDTPGTIWLLVGSDSRAGLDETRRSELAAGDAEGARTDTIMLMYLPRSGRPTLISIPRDSYLEIPGNGPNRINAAFSIGGPSLLVRAVEHNTGVHIDHYAEIGFAGLAGVVDALDGVHVCLDEPLRDPMAGIDLAAGCQDLRGPDALGYARSRYVSARGDLDRVVRQRDLLGAIGEKAGSAGTMLNPFRGIPAASAMLEALTIDKRDHIWHLVPLARAMSGMRTTTVPIGGMGTVDGMSVITWGDETRRFFDVVKTGRGIPDEMMTDVPR